MRNQLLVLFAFIFLCMIAMVAWAMMQRGMLAAGGVLMEERWFHVTLADAYFGFITFYVWVWYKEAAIGRGVWFLLIMTLGNLAMAAYMMIALWRLPANASWSELCCAARICGKPAANAGPCQRALTTGHG